MYNGIGLPTPRGSGTSGYIQRNLSYVKPRRSDFPSSVLGLNLENENRRLPKVRKANTELLQHEKKRKVEVQLVIYADKLKDAGISEEEIEKRVKDERQRILDVINHSEQEVKGRNAEERAIIDRFDTHKLAAMKEKENEKFRSALRLDQPPNNKPTSAPIISPDSLKSHESKKKRQRSPSSSSSTLSTSSSDSKTSRSRSESHSLNSKKNYKTIGSSDKGKYQERRNDGRYPLAEEHRSQTKIDHGKHGRENNIEQSMQERRKSPKPEERRKEKQDRHSQGDRYYDEDKRRSNGRWNNDRQSGSRGVHHTYNYSNRDDRRSNHSKGHEQWKRDQESKRRQSSLSRSRSRPHRHSSNE